MCNFVQLYNIHVCIGKRSLIVYVYYNSNTRTYTKYEKVTILIYVVLEYGPMCSTVLLQFVQTWARICRRLWTLRHRFQESIPYEKLILTWTWDMGTSIPNLFPNRFQESIFHPLTRLQIPALERFREVRQSSLLYYTSLELASTTHALPANRQTSTCLTGRQSASYGGGGEPIQWKQNKGGCLYLFFFRQLLYLISQIHTGIKSTLSRSQLYTPVRDYEFAYWCSCL